MKNSFLKLCSMFLVLVLLINMLPLQVFAQQLNTDKEEQSVTEVLPAETETSSDRIVTELVHKRTEYSKEFLLESGVHMATVYPEAVHYATEEGWEEIDNTLVTKTDGTLTNTAGVWDVSFPQQLSRDKSVTITKDGYTLSFAMAGELTNSGNIAVMSASLTKETAGETLAVGAVRKASASVQKPDLTAMRTSVQYEEMVPEKARSQIAYANVYQNTDVIYDLNSNRVKESVVLESYNSALRGYRYSLDVGEMIPVLDQEGQILFYNADRKNIIMVMPAPYMIDDEGAYNDDIQVQLTGSGSHYTLTYLLPTQWLAAEERAWPVILDPEVTPTLTTTNIRDRSVTEHWIPSQTWGYNSCGYFNPEGIVRFFLKYDNLPNLTSSDVIIGASISMYKADGTAPTMPVYVHKVLDTWASETITWANMPDFDDNIEDYAIVQANQWYTWDVTDIARGWYEGENTGMMFKGPNEVESASVGNYKQFLSSDHGSNKPILVITFRNNNGLEGYWDYTSASAGRAGTGYVNNYTGNLVWVRDDIGFGGNRMPVAINHVYNANDAYTFRDSNNSNDSAGNGFGLGNGWRTNYNQLVYQWSTDSAYYVWEDEDGTDHYFKLNTETGDYEDEDNLDLTLKVQKTGSVVTGHTITNKQGCVSYFDSRGRLYKIENNQKIKSSITIDYVGDTQRINWITDGVGRKYEFTYNASQLLEKIRYIGSGTTEISYVEYEYEGTNLTRVIDKDGKSSVYTYNEVIDPSIETANLLTSAEDVDGYMLSYTYNTMVTGQPARIQTAEESYCETGGAMLTFTYQHNQTTLTDHNGNVQIMQFNNMGNTLCIQDDEGRAQHAQFNKNDMEDTGKANQLRLTSRLQNTVGNMLNDSSFEKRTLWTITANEPYAYINGSVAYHGSRSMKVTTSVSGSGVHENTYTIGAGETVTFSAYVRTGDASVEISIYDWSGLTTSETLEPYTDWTRLEVSYTNTSSEPKNICPHILTITPGSFWVDCVQLERAPTASRYNLVENGDFRYSSNRWSSTSGLTLDDEAAAAVLQNTVYAITGSPTEYNRLSQTVFVNGSEGDSFVFGGWAKGNSAPLETDNHPNSQFALLLRFNYVADTEEAYFLVPFNPDVDQWQYVASAAVAIDEYESITMFLLYDYNVNTVYFDGIQLFKEEFGVSYTYDEDGNVISVTDLQKQKTEYEYDENDLTQIIQDGNIKLEYEYDDYHNVERAISDEDLVYEFDYDDYGNNTQVSVTNGYWTMATSATYSPDGNYPVSTTDALGEVTTYGYNTETGELDWVQNPGDTEDSRINYSYDEMYRAARVETDVDTGATLAVDYTYNNDHLTRIETNSTDYYISYGEFGLKSDVWAGEYLLAIYEYTWDGNHNPRAIIYDNADYTRYSYDDEGRLIEEFYGNSFVAEDENYDTVQYRYDNSGRLIERTEQSWDTDATTRYYYDFLDRIVKYVREDGSTDTVQYTYNEKGNLSQLQHAVDSHLNHTVSYTYDDKDRPVGSTSGSSESTITYDGLGRVYEKYVYHDDEYVASHTYYYDESPDGNASTRVRVLDADGWCFEYRYDGNGNILSVDDGVFTTSYVYDSANQLIRENNEEYGFTHTWEYDNAGNILCRKEYAFTTGSLEGVTPTDTVVYTYDTELGWGDLLVGYDGNTITRDGIGNPLSDGTWTYTWKHGRQLESMSDSDVTWTYQYNADGLRTYRYSDDASYYYSYIGDKLWHYIKDYTSFTITYDAMGMPYSLSRNNDTYYYILNVQGDIVAINDDEGNTVVYYVYDAWGNLISMTDTSGCGLGTGNVLRYRGYVYDTETGLYYLQSRYYNPELGRFLNADGVMSGVGGDVRGYNLFAYCMNNPVNMSDSSGNWPKWNDFVTMGKKLLDTVVHTMVSVNVPIVSTMVKQLHYGRNALNNTSYTENELIEQGITKESADADKFHQNNQQNGERNRKYVIGDWCSSEVVYYADGTINDTPEDRGTFNVYSGDNAFLNIAIHGVFDVAPYMIWGNSKDDSTTIVDRFIMIWE